MTRETDSSSSGPQGRGGPAYPSGTPPYGPRPFPSLHPQERPRPAGAPEPGPTPPAEPAEPAADEPKTETTLTTRIRINIPGSRPIPPVVLRTPVDENAAAAAAEAAAQEQAAVEAAAAEAEPEPEPEPEKTSDWFAPRKPVGPQGPGATGSGGTVGGSGGVSGGTSGGPFGGAATTPGPGGSGGPGGTLGGGFTVPGTGEGARPGAPAPDNYLRPTLNSDPDPFAGSYGSPVADPDTGSHAAPFGDSATGSHRAPFGDPDTGAHAVPFGDPDTGSHPAAPFGDPDTGSHRAPFGDSATGSHRAPFGDPDTGSHRAPFGDPDTGAHAVPFGDPDTGSHPAPGAFLPPPVGSPLDGGPGGRGPHDTPAGGFPSTFDTSTRGRFPEQAPPPPFGPDDFPPGVPRPVDPFASRPPRVPGPDDPFAEYRPPNGPTSGPGTGDMSVPPTGDTSFRPQAPEASGPPPAERVSGDTLVSGIPAVPPGEVRGPRPPAGARSAPDPRPVPEPAPAPARVPAPAPRAAAAKKGRSKLVLLGVAVGGALVIAYGAGLLMNHADVPKGTTVVGVDIGNMNQDVAVKTLDKALGNRTTAGLDLTIGGKTQTLKPSVAGLSVDTDATVQKVAHSDYNPVSVIGSLFGGSRTADPVVLVDQDKLKSALQSVAGRNSAGSDGMVRFADGKAVAVAGRPSQSFDVNSAAAQVAGAYRTRAETGVNSPISLKVSTVPPKVTQAELDKAVNGFGKTAMQGPVYIRADAVHVITFNKSLPKFLTMTVDSEGKLAPHIDLTVLKSLYGTTFNGVLLKRADGSKSAVTPEDVAASLIKGLGAADSVDRNVTLPNVAK